MSFVQRVSADQSDHIVLSMFKIEIFWPHRAVDKIWIGSDRIGLTNPGPDRIGLTKPGSDRIGLKKPGSDQ